MAFGSGEAQRVWHASFLTYPKLLACLILTSLIHVGVCVIVDKLCWDGRVFEPERLGKQLDAHYCYVAKYCLLHTFLDNDILDSDSRDEGGSKHRLNSKRPNLYL